MSLTFKENISLKPFNSFAIDAQVKYFAAIQDINDLPKLANSYPYKNKKTLWLGGGSNILLTKNIDMLLVKVETRGIHIIEQKNDKILVEVAAGEPWNNFVQYTMQKSWFGLENLSLIPGTVGASPVQNIGAYGVEVKDFIDSVICVDLNKNCERIIFKAKDCNFSYRDSIFKQEKYNKLLIESVRFRLNLIPNIKAQYGDIQQELINQKINQTPSPQQVAQAIISLRKRKLPDPDLLANVGSFFKNPIIENQLADKLISKYPKLVYYPTENNKTKLAAAWLIDNANLKGFRMGPVGVHEKQALVLVNYANATGLQIMQLARYIQKTVYDIYGVLLDIEPRLIS